jgi:hypothetical protein
MGLTDHFVVATAWDQDFFAGIDLNPGTDLVVLPAPRHEALAPNMEGAVAASEEFPQHPCHPLRIVGWNRCVEDHFRLPDHAMESQHAEA